MEILNDNFPSLFLNTGLLISGICVALLVLITAVHWQSDRHQKHTLAFSRANEPLVMSYLEGDTSKKSVIRSMGEKPLEAMNLLMKLHRKQPPAEQSRLLPLFAELPDVEKEISALDSRHTKRRLQAAERLGYLKNEKSSDALLYALEDDVLAVRYCAARSLAAHGKTAFIEPTLLAFDAEREIDWLRLVEIIYDYGEAAVPTLLTVLENKGGIYSNNIINVAIRTLGMLQEPQAVQPLIGLLSHPDFSIRLNAARALGEIGDPTAISPVAELSHDPDWAVRNKAVEAIGRLHAETQMPILEEALSDSSWWVRYSAAQALHSLGQPGIEKMNEIMKTTQDLYAHDMCRQVLREHDVHDTKNNPL